MGNEPSLSGKRDVNFCKVGTKLANGADGSSAMKKPIHDDVLHTGG
jgi:hypothetical protein